MTEAQERIQETERRLAKVEALAQMLDDMHESLSGYREALSQKLALLQQGEQRAKNSTPTKAPSRHDSKALPRVAARKAPEPEPEPEPEPSEEEENLEAKRAAPRRQGNPVQVNIADATNTMEGFQGWVIDRSAGGLRILVDQTVHPGTLLNLKPVKAHAGSSWVEVKVCNCMQERGSYSIGVQFTAKLTWAELQVFG